MSYSTITTKQAGVIFGAWKRGELVAEKKDIDMMYGRYVGSSSPTTNARELDVAAKLRAVLDAIFAHDMETAAAKFSAFVDCHHTNFSDSIFV